MHKTYVSQINRAPYVLSDTFDVCLLIKYILSLFALHHGHNSIIENNRKLGNSRNL